MQQQQQQQQQERQPMPPTPGNYPTAYNYGLVDYLLDTTIMACLELGQRALMSPVDRVSVLTAVEGELVRQKRLPSKGFGGIVGCYKRIWKKEGFTGLFRGVLTDFAFALPASLIDNLSTQVVFTLIQAVLPESFTNQMGMTSIVTISMVASVLSVYASAPYNNFRKTVVTNYVADIVAPIDGEATDEKEEEEEKEAAATSIPKEEGYRYNSAQEAATTIHKRKGWRAFYLGIHAEPLLIMTYRGLYVLASITIPENVQVGHPFLVARGLALVADLVTQPLEVASRRLFLTASAEDTPYNGVWDCMKQIKETEGVTALWSGLKFRLLLSFVSMGVRGAYSILSAGRQE